MDWQQILDHCRKIKSTFDKSYKCLNIDRPIGKETIVKHLEILLQCLEEIRTNLNVYYQRLTPSHKIAAEAFFHDIRNKILVIATKKGINIITIPETIQEQIETKLYKQTQEINNIPIMASFSLETTSKALTLFAGNTAELESFLITAELINKTLSDTAKLDFLQYVYHAKLTSNVRTAIGNYSKPENFESLKSLLEQRYKIRTTIPELQNKLHNLVQGKMSINNYNEKILNIIDNLNKLGIEELGQTATTAEKNVIIKLNSKLALDTFKRGLSETFKSTIYASRPNTLQEATDLAIELENESKANHNAILHINKPRYQLNRYPNNNQNRQNNTNNYNNNNQPHRNNSRYQNTHDIQNNRSNTRNNTRSSNYNNYNNQQYRNNNNNNSNTRSNNYNNNNNRSNNYNNNNNNRSNNYNNQYNRNNDSNNNRNNRRQIYNIEEANTQEQGNITGSE